MPTWPTWPKINPYPPSNTPTLPAPAPAPAPAPRPPDPAKRRKELVSTSSCAKQDAKGWHKNADVIAGVDTRMAARMRDVARALESYAQLCDDIRKTEGP